MRDSDDSGENNQRLLDLDDADGVQACKSYFVSIENLIKCFKI